MIIALQYLEENIFVSSVSRSIPWGLYAACRKLAQRVYIGRSRAIAVKPVAFAWPAYCSLPRQPDLHRTEVCHAGFFV